MKQEAELLVGTFCVVERDMFSWLMSILTSISSLFSWQPANKDKNDLIDTHIWLHNRERAHHVEIVHVETRPLSNAPHKK